METEKPNAEEKISDGPQVEEGAEFSQSFVPPTVEELQKLIPAYEFIEFIDKGGMGAVYKAVQPALSRTVALKLLPPNVGKGLAFEQRFRREARTMAKLSHPNIVSVYDFGETSEGHLFIVMEYIEGSDLRHLIRERKLMPEQILPIIDQVCAALRYAHDHEIIHRDIKPANIFIDTNGTVKVGDFGLAKPRDTSDEASMISMAGFNVGTPSYMAPEALEEEDIDHRADIYSLGVVIYEMLTGSVPKGAWEPPSKCAGSDLRFDEVISRAMQANREERFQHADDVSHAFETDSFVSRQHPELAKRNMSILSVTLFVLIGILFVAGFLLYTAPGRRFDFFGLVERTPPPLSTAEFDQISREMAAWVFSKGGHVQLRSVNDDVNVYSKSDLPKGVFEIWRISFEHQSTFTDEDMKRLIDYCAPLPTVTNLNFKYTSISPVGLAEVTRVSGHLRGLNIAGTLASSDDSIDVLLKCKNLGILLLNPAEEQTESPFRKLSADGVQRLKEGLPDTNVRLADI